MARFGEDDTRVNRSIHMSGQEYNKRTLERAKSVFSTLLNNLPSNYISTIEGPNYTIQLKCVALEIARLELALEDCASDRDFTKTRSEFIWSMIGYLVFVNGKLPETGFNDEEFRAFLLAMIQIYFQGSIPKSIKDATELLFKQGVSVFENFLLQRQGASGVDISDQFGFQIQIQGFPPDMFQFDALIRVILDIIRPAHTLFTLRYLFTDRYLPNDTIGKIIDAVRWRMSDYMYDDVRRYWGGIRDRDRLGMKYNVAVVDEDHSGDFLEAARTGLVFVSWYA